MAHEVRELNQFLHTDLQLSNIHYVLHLLLHYVYTCSLKSQ